MHRRLVVQLEMQCFVLCTVLLGFDRDVNFIILMVKLPGIGVTWMLPLP